MLQALLGSYKLAGKKEALVVMVRWPWIILAIVICQVTTSKTFEILDIIESYLVGLLAYLLEG